MLNLPVSTLFAEKVTAEMLEEASGNAAKSQMLPWLDDETTTTQDMHSQETDADAFQFGDQARHEQVIEQLDTVADETARQHVLQTSLAASTEQAAPESALTHQELAAQALRGMGDMMTSAMAMFAVTTRDGSARSNDDGGVSAKLFTPTDDLFTSQWHLNNTGAGLLDLGDLQTVWDDYTGAGVEVAVMDDGFQRDHHQLNGNYSTGKDWDFRDDDTNPSPGAGDNHGTAVMGIIASDLDGVGTVGIAYGATKFGFRVGDLINDTLVDTMIGAANYASGVGGSGGYQADIMNMSYGTMYRYNYFDTALTTGGPDGMDALNAAFDNGVVSGRGGLGTIYVKSAGNSRTTLTPDGTGNTGHDANASSWNANMHTISVAAVDQNGFVSSYSTHGANILISGFGTPGQVVTTDRTGTDGYASGDYTFGFNGTSAAAPMVSGVIALMLEANPDLGWRDVQEILANSARHVGSNVGSGTAGSEEYAWFFNGAGTWNGGGLHFSNDYGFGLIDAHAAVRMAESWGSASKTSANDASSFNDVLNASVTINSSNVPNLFNFTPTSNIIIEHVEVDINFTQWYDLGDLDIKLIAPDGTVIHLIDNTGENDGTAAGGFGSGRWEFFSPGLMGMNSSGSWQLQIRDQDSNSVSPITINDIDITFRGMSNTSSRTYVFTNEYSEFDGLFGHSTTINAGSGVDTVNASAVTSNSIINLAGGTNTSRIDGVFSNLQNFENAHGGDGNDTITGNGSANVLNGWRGNDVLNGASGVDQLFGGDGDDTLNGGLHEDNAFGGAGNDLFLRTADHFGDNVDGGSGIDTIDVSGSTDTAGFAWYFNLATGNYNLVPNSGASYAYTITNVENVVGSNANDEIIGSTGSNVLNGWGGNDTIDGGGGDDTLLGGLGNDVLDVGSGTDRAYGEGGNDRLNRGGGSALEDEYYGGSGIDTIGTDGVSFVSGVHFRMDLGMMLLNGSNYEIWDNFENYDGSSGTGQEDVTGTSGANLIETGSGSNELFGLGGNDTLNAGGGNDTLTGGAGGDSLVGGAGLDTADYTGSDAGVNVSLLTGWAAGGHATGDSISGIENLTGSVFDDLLNGDHEDNILSGRAGGDFLNGRGGSDTASYVGSNAAVNVSLLTGWAAGGHAAGDTFNSIENLIGSDYNDLLNGDHGDNILRGGAGGDFLNGRGGSDTADYTDSNAAVNVSLLTGWAAGGHAVGDTFNSIENLSGSDFDDLLNGDHGDNILRGGAGGDFLNGRGGSDTADYTASNAGVNVSLLTGFAAGGHAVGDTFNSIENLSGSDHNDILSGDNGANILNGGEGNDILRGRAGIDTFEFEDDFGNDTVVDFSNGSEQFDFSDHSGVSGFGDLTVGSSGGNALISDGYGNTITVTGAAGLIDASDFIF